MDKYKKYMDDPDYEFVPYTKAPNEIEVEGGETIKGDYVYSKELGFAQLHRPIMKAKGKIEAKPATRERMNSIKLLNEKEGMLEQAQEFFKSRYGIQ